MTEAIPLGNIIVTREMQDAIKELRERADGEADDPTSVATLLVAAAFVHLTQTMPPAEACITLSSIVEVAFGADRSVMH